MMASQAFDPRMLVDRKSRLINKLMQQQQQRPGVAARMGHSPSMGQPFRSSVYGPKPGGRPVMFGKNNIAQRVLAALGVTAGHSPDVHPGGGPLVPPPFQAPASLDPGAVIGGGGGVGGSPPVGLGGGTPPPTDPTVLANTAAGTSPDLNNPSGGQQYMPTEGTPPMFVDLGNGDLLNLNTGEIVRNSPSPLVGGAARGLGGAPSAI